MFALLTLAFLALAIGWLTESPAVFAKNSDAWIHLGGWLGLLTAVAGLVRVVRRGHELDVQAGRPARVFPR